MGSHFHSLIETHVLLHLNYEQEIAAETQIRKGCLTGKRLFENAMGFSHYQSNFKMLETIWKREYC